MPQRRRHGNGKIRTNLRLPSCVLARGLRRGLCGEETQQMYGRTATVFMMTNQVMRIHLFFGVQFSPCHRLCWTNPFLIGCHARGAWFNFHIYNGTHSYPSFSERLLTAHFLLLLQISVQIPLPLRTFPPTSRKIENSPCCRGSWLLMLPLWAWPQWATDVIS